MSTEIVKFDLNSPNDALQVANVLQTFVKDKKLTATIQGKQYPLVEAWQFAGSQLGLYPILTDVQNLSSDKELKYSARVEIRRLSDDKLLSLGIAICSNLEASKKRFDEYAICSMAQTRAEGKAYRMLLSWLMKAAGFEATPAEEMDFARTQDITDSPDEGERKLLRNLVFTSDLNDDEKESALSLIDLCGDYEQYQKIQHRLEARQLSDEEKLSRGITPSAKEINGAVKSKANNVNS